MDTYCIVLLCVHPKQKATRWIDCLYNRILHCPIKRLVKREWPFTEKPSKTTFFCGPVQRGVKLNTAVREERELSGQRPAKRHPNQGPHTAWRDVDTLKRGGVINSRSSEVWICFSAPPAGSSSNFAVKAQNCSSRRQIIPSGITSGHIDFLWAVVICC